MQARARFLSSTQTTHASCLTWRGRVQKVEGEDVELDGQALEVQHDAQQAGAQDLWLLRVRHLALELVLGVQPEAPPGLQTRDRWVTLRARWVALRACWVTLGARWVTLRARCVTLRARWVTLRASSHILIAGASAVYCDEKVANRDIRVWHFVIENGY
jgi:hypothetical protein